MGNEQEWVLKHFGYNGSETVVGFFWKKHLAAKAARELNDAYQSDRYRVEPYDPQRLQAFTQAATVREVTRRLRGY